MGTKKTMVHGTDKDPRLMERADVAIALANEYNFDKIMMDLEQSKNNIAQMKETIKKGKI